MKKLVKILVSALLVLAIVFSIAWYLFEYDPGFTRDLLLQQAHKFEERGRNSIAVWLYDLAYRQAGQDDSVAIELANYYKSKGNYSKAEYTLAKAIEDGGGLELYIALCRIYVEQDKLRDAVAMLDHVSNTEIKAQLDALRPEAPTASYRTGYYSQYIRVDFQSENATVYAATDHDYPSTKTDLLTGPVSLPRGETTFFTVAVADNGLVSPMVEYQYTVCDVVEPVTFQDTAFEDAIRSLLEVSENTTIFSDTLWQITAFQMPASAASCQDLMWLPNLTELTISGSTFSDLQILSGMTQLETLTIQECVLSAQDLKCIAQLPKLKNLTLSGCYLSTIDHLSYATGLQYLDLSRNSIRDLSALSQLTKLEHLDLRENAVISLDAITSLTKLTHLDVSYNSLLTTAPVIHFPELEYLDISANNLMNVQVEGIEQLTKLTWFAASKNNLVNVDFLAGATGLTSLIVSDNTVIDLRVVSNFLNLEYLDFSYNEVERLPTFSKDCPLGIIVGSHNKLSSLDALAVLQKLEFVYMDYNKSLKKIDKLADCPMLQLVNVYGTGVRNAGKLLDKGIAVNYTPV